MNANSSALFPTFRKAAAATRGFLRAFPGFCLRRLKALPHRLRLLFFSRSSLKCYLVLTTLVILTYTSLRWLGRRAWEAEKQHVAALEMAGDLQDFATPTPRDEDNFLAAEVFQDLLVDRPGNPEKYSMWFSKTNWAAPRPKGVVRSTGVPRPKQDTLTEWGDYFRLTGMFPTPSNFKSTAEEILADQRWVPTIQAIYAAAARPASKFPASENPKSDGLPGWWNHNKLLYNLHRSVLLYAQAHLEEGDPAQALPALRVTDHFVRAHAAEPGYLPVLHLIGRLKTENVLLQTGMRLHRWPALTLKNLLAANYPEFIQQVTRRRYEFERMGTSSFLNNFPESFYETHWMKEHPYRRFFYAHILPEYLFQRAAVRTSRHYRRMFEAAAPLGTNETWPARIQTLSNAPDPHLGLRFLIGRELGEFSPTRDFAYGHVTPIIQTSIRHLAIAIELHYLIHSKYPPSLDQLDPAISISPQLTKDFDGQRIRYQTSGAGSFFTVYSVGVDGLENSPRRFPDDLVFSTDPGRPVRR
jgi:hypothetical protein